MATAVTRGDLVTWSGNAGDGLFATNGNWTRGTPPNNNDWQDTAVFASTATPVAVTLGSARSIAGITFQTAGWTMQGSSFTNLGAVSSSGDGTNLFSTSFSLHNSRTWTIAEGNTLHMSGVVGSFYLRSNNLTLTGGGKLIISNSIGGFSSGAWGINIGPNTLQMNTAAIFSTGTSSSSALRITSEDSILRIAATTGQVQSLINSNRILDTTGIGLMVTDVGGGYSQVTVIPEPAALSLLALACLCLIPRRR